MDTHAGDVSNVAPGWPGIAPTRTSSAKDLVTTAPGPSRLWAAIGHGILNEIYWPSSCEPQVRDLGFVVAGRGGWHELKRIGRYRLSPEPFHSSAADRPSGRRVRRTRRRCAVRRQLARQRHRPIELLSSVERRYRSQRPNNAGPARIFTFGSPNASALRDLLIFDQRYACPRTGKTSDARGTRPTRRPLRVHPMRMLFQRVPLLLVESRQIRRPRGAAAGLSLPGGLARRRHGRASGQS